MHPLPRGSQAAATHLEPLLCATQYRRPHSVARHATLRPTALALAAATTLTLAVAVAVAVAVAAAVAAGSGAGRTQRPGRPLRRAVRAREDSLDEAGPPGALVAHIARLAWHGTAEGVGGRRGQGRRGQGWRGQRSPVRRGRPAARQAETHLVALPRGNAQVAAAAVAAQPPRWRAAAAAACPKARTGRARSAPSKGV